MAEINNTYILEKLQQQFGADIYQAEEPYGMLTLTLNPARIIDVLKWLKNHEELKADFLTDICGNHYPQLENKELNIIYHVQSMINNFRIRIKCYVPISNPNIETATGLYLCADWMERETYDFYGVIFTGHPNLKRILNVDEMDYFPMRKEYPLEDGTRTDKEDNYFGR